MKHKISSKELTDGKCWSAKRFLESCDECINVQKCELPEGKEGHIKLLSKEILETKEKLRDLHKQIHELNYELSRSRIDNLS